MLLNRFDVETLLTIQSLTFHFFISLFLHLLSVLLFLYLGLHHVLKDKLMIFVNANFIIKEIVLQPTGTFQDNPHTLQFKSLYRKPL